MARSWSIARWVQLLFCLTSQSSVQIYIKRYTINFCISFFVRQSHSKQKCVLCLLRGKRDFKRSIRCIVSRLNIVGFMQSIITKCSTIRYNWWCYCWWRTTFCWYVEKKKQILNSNNINSNFTEKKTIYFHRNMEKTSFFL